MDDTPEFGLLGPYPPADAERVIAVLEEAGIPFDVESDHSKLSDPMRHVALYFAMGPEGSKLGILVRAEDFERAGRLVIERVFPISDRAGRPGDF